VDPQVRGVGKALREDGAHHPGASRGPSREGEDGDVLGGPAIAYLHSRSMSAQLSDLSKLRIDRDATPAVRRAFRWNLVLAVVALVIIATVVAWARRGAAPLVQVVVAVAAGGGASGGAGTSVTANGYVVARTRAAVSAKLAGRLAYLGVSEGSFVRKGEIIARLENADYAAAVAQAEATVATARAERLEADAERDQLRREAQRLRDIRDRNAQLVSDQEVEAAESRAVQAEARAQAAEARGEAAAAGLRFAEANLQNTLIRAPFTGTVLRKEAEVGEVVAPSVGGSLTRGAVVTMADLSTLEVEVDVNEAYIARITGAQPARIILDAYPDTGFHGAVRQVVPTADRQRATVQVKVSILDRDPRILPEMGARVDFLEEGGTGGTDGRIRLPVAAVRDEGGQTVVWLVRDGRLEPRPVQAGPASAGFREIRTGLAGGELVLVGGVETPRAGMRVTVPNP
jgi:RND family efflux transporter MFP subunit